MTSAGVERAGHPARRSARLGLALRVVLASPVAGFGSLLEDSGRRTGRPGARTAAVFSALGGAALSLLWLKAAGMAGIRDVSPRQYEWTLLASTMLGGAVIAVLAQALWSVAGPSVSRSLGSDARGSDLRLVWGVAMFPLIPTLVALLPLDLVLVGPRVFATRALGESFATIWAAFSVAAQACAGAWSLYLFVRGTEAATRLDPLRAIAASAFGGVCLTGVAAILVVAAIAIGG